MSLTKERIGEIGYALYKRELKKKSSFREVYGNAKRKLDDISKETGIRKDELIDFIQFVLDDMSKEQIASLEKLGKKIKAKIKTKK